MYKSSSILKLLSAGTVKATTLLVCAALMLGSCSGPELVKDHVLMPEEGWHAESVVQFSFEVKDAQQAHNVYYFLRQNLNYPYSNIYLRDSIVDAQGYVAHTSTKQFFVANPFTGQPIGSGLAEMRDNTMLGYEAIKFPKAGKYTIRVRQYMRISPLPGILSAGVMVLPLEGKK